VSDLEKATYANKRRLLSRALPTGYIEDFDDEFVYYEKYVSDRDTYATYKAPYTLEGVSVTVDTESEVEVEPETQYVEKSEAVANIVAEALEKFFGAPKKEQHVVKMFDDVQMLVTEPLYIAFGEVDAHGDAYKDKDSVLQMVDSFNAALEKGMIKSSLFHTHETECFTPVRAFVYETETTLGDHTIPAYQPLVENQFHSETAFELRKSMDLLGVSIGARANREEGELLKSAEFAKLKKEERVNYLSDFTFEYEGAHLAYTDSSANGAASLKNFYYLAKSKDVADLSAEQKRILELLGEEFTPLSKSVESTPSSAEDSAGEDKIITKENGNSETMTEKEKELADQIAELQKQNKEQAIKLTAKDLGEYGFEGETLADLSKVYVELSGEGQSVLVKAFEALTDKTKEVEQQVVELKKAAADAEPTDLEKEQGNEEEHEDEGNLSLRQKIEKARASKESE